jgi:ribosomal protein L10
MSKKVKELLTQEFAHRLSDVQDALLVNVIGLDANQSVVLRRQLRDKNIQLLVIRNGLARRATEGTPLGTALADAEGSLALVWGGEDFVSLAKEITQLDEDSELEAFQTRGGVMDGEKLTAERVKEISRWPSRQEQLSLLSGQILGPGAELVAALLGPASALASQVKQKADEDSPPAESPES